jgi:hypothetical protein
MITGIQSRMNIRARCITPASHGILDAAMEKGLMGTLQESFAQPWADFGGFAEVI